MIVDSSAMVAMVTLEPDWRLFLDALAATGSRRMSAAGYLETAIVVDAKGDRAASDRLDEVIHNLRIEIVPVTPGHARLAREAYRRFGKGNHPARLNFGDCFAYALARATGEPLLFKGEDFAKTDVRPAL